MPPVELEFEDVVDAVLKADEVVAPDDEHDYRAALGAAFAAFGINRRHRRIIDLSQAGTPELRADELRDAALRSATRSFRFIWENAQVLRDRPRLPDSTSTPCARRSASAPTACSSPRSSPTTSSARADRGRGEAAGGGAAPTASQPDDAAAALGRRRARLRPVRPRQAPPGQAARPTGSGRRDGSPTSRASGLFDTQGRLGFTISTPRGQRFAALHVADSQARNGERPWLIRPRKQSRPSPPVRFWRHPADQLRIRESAR